MYLRTTAYNGNKAYIHASNAFNIYLMAILTRSYRTKNQKRRVSHTKNPKSLYTFSRKNTIIDRET